MLEVGSIVGGKFRIEQILGQGGMGVVAVATHLQLDQPVALKVALQRTPRNVLMLGVAVTAACHLQKPETARGLLRRLPQGRQRALRQRCAAEGILL